MAFTLPVFNLTCNIWRGPWLPLHPVDVVSPCNLAYGRRVQTNFGNFTGGPGSAVVMTLLLPPLTDVRSWVQSADPDAVEVPAGSGRYYRVEGVDDVGKGFANEHRAATLAQSSQLLSTIFLGQVWPLPVP